MLNLAYANDVTDIANCDRAGLPGTTSAKVVPEDGRLICHAYDTALGRTANDIAQCHLTLASVVYLYDCWMTHANGAADNWDGERLTAFLLKQDGRVTALWKVRFRQVC